MVRVASLKDQVHANYTKKDLSGMDAKEQLAGISKRTHELVQLQYNTYNRSANEESRRPRRFRLWSTLALRLSASTRS